MYAHWCASAEGRRHLQERVHSVLATRCEPVFPSCAICSCQRGGRSRHQEEVHGVRLSTISGFFGMFCRGSRLAGSSDKSGRDPGVGVRGSIDSRGITVKEGRISAICFGGGARSASFAPCAFAFFGASGIVVTSFVVATRGSPSVGLSGTTVSMSLSFYFLLSFYKEGPVFVSQLSRPLSGDVVNWGWGRSKLKIHVWTVFRPLSLL